MKYEIKFEDTFSFAVETREAELTDAQHAVALRQMANKQIVVNRYNHKEAIQWLLIIKSITPIVQNTPILS